MKDRKILNQIYESVYEQKVPELEKFMHKFDRSDDRLLEAERRAVTAMTFEPDTHDYIDELSDLECEEITGDWINLVLNEGISSRDALSTISEGWGFEVDIIKDVINSVIGGYLSGYQQS